MESLSCFKAYDIRGQLGNELNPHIAYRIGRAFGLYLSPKGDGTKTVVVGGDIRLTSEELKLAVADGLMDSGVNVVDIGMTGTEEIYFATSYLGADGGIEITASHNPIDYNGMKLVREESKPISGDTGLKEIQTFAERNEFTEPSIRGRLTRISNLAEYVNHLMTYIKPETIRPMKLVVNSGNGAAGHVIDEIESRFNTLGVPVEFVKIHHEADGSFPNGIPNPLLHENRAITSQAVVQCEADMGIAWDGDFDRCFLFDESGEFVEGYYIVGLLAEAFLTKNPESRIIHDPRLYWSTLETVHQYDGTPVLSKTGHAFIKERMRAEDAIYGGEMSAHHYFREFFYCDSGMIPWMLIIELLSNLNCNLSDLISERKRNYPTLGELNRKVEDPDKVINVVYQVFKADAIKIDTVDGLSMEFDNWRFNLRKSNTESLLRLNLESRGNIELMKAMTEQILGYMV